MAGGGGGGRKLPPVDHDPLNEGAVGKTSKSTLCMVAYTNKLQQKYKITSNLKQTHTGLNIRLSQET